MNFKTLLPVAALVPVIALLSAMAPQQGFGGPGALPVGLPGDVPIGTILAWWGDPRHLPAGFELCDGKHPEDREALFEFRKPDLRGQFLRGAGAPQAFNPRGYETNGHDTVTVQLPKDKLLAVNQLPPHVHPMPHVHSIGDHVHRISDDVDLKANDPANKAHVHELTAHDHVVAAHGHTSPTHTHTIDVDVVDEAKRVKDDIFVDPGNTSVFTSTKSVEFTTDGTAVTIAGQPQSTTAGLSGNTPPDTGKGKGFVATKDLLTGPGLKPVGFTPADTGPINGSPNTGTNAGPQQPLDLGEVEFDNRPAHFDVLWIIRVK